MTPTEIRSSLRRFLASAIRTNGLGDDENIFNAGFR
jgi:hypothetical protein